MKKIALLLAAAAMSAGVFAELPSYVKFASTGPDKYADGSLVLDGEVYALVWTKTGATFAGFNADGTVVDAENNKLISAAAVAINHHCPTVMYMLTGTNSVLATAGSFSVYLFDTRVRAADGTTSVGGVTAGAVTAINATSAAAATVQCGGKTKVEESVQPEGYVQTAVPADAPNPRITAINVVGGQVIVKVADTKPYLQYGISAGKTPSKLDQNDLIDGVNGTDEGLTLIVDDPVENRFFKVIRK